MDDEQLAKAFAHLTAEEFEELVDRFSEDGVPLAKDSESFMKLWNI